MGESSGSIFQTIIRLLPILMIGLLIMGMVMFVVTSVVPRWREFQTINTELEAAKQTLADQSAAGSDAIITVLQRQIQKAQDSLQQAASIFMTETQAHDILDNLYAYASQSGVQITTLQAQQSAQTNAGASSAQPPRQNSGKPTPAPPIDPATIYGVQAFRLRVDGKVPGLMAFVTRIREATIAGVVISNLDLHLGAVQDTLMMDVLIYNSPFSTGESYVNVPEVELPPALALPITIASTQTTASDGGIVAVTPNAEATTVPEPPLTLLFSDSFDSGELQHWNLGAGWHLASDTGGQVLEVKDSSSDLTLAYNTLKDTAIQARVWLDTGGIRISLRQSAAGRYSTTLDSLGLVALYRGENLVQTSFSAISGVSRWRTLRVSAIQGVIRVSVDGVELLHITDSSEFPPGTVSIAMIGKGSVRLDDIEVWVFGPADNSGTPAP